MKFCIGKPFSKQTFIKKKRWERLGGKPLLISWKTLSFFVFSINRGRSPLDRPGSSGDSPPPHPGHTLQEGSAWSPSLCLPCLPWYPKCRSEATQVNTFTFLGLHSRSVNCMSLGLRATFCFENRIKKRKREILCTFYQKPDKQMHWRNYFENVKQVLSNKAMRKSEKTGSVLAKMIQTKA